MFKRLLFTALCAGFFLGISYAQQSTITIPTGKTVASDGKQMFVTYCATCHGVDGHGRGPVASALVIKPVDLTLLSKNSGGKYPLYHVMAVINFGSPVAAHGTKDMPVWGPILAAMDHTEATQELRTLRVTNLADYIESLQTK